MVTGYPLSQHSVAPADCRNDAFGIEIPRKAYIFGPFVRYEHFLHECSRRANNDPKIAIRRRYPIYGNIIPGFDYSIKTR